MHKICLIYLCFDFSSVSVIHGLRFFFFCVKSLEYDFNNFPFSTNLPERDYGGVRERKESKIYNSNSRYRWNKNLPSPECFYYWYKVDIENQYEIVGLT